MRILFCGLSGIPNKASASINRYLAIGQTLSENNEIIYINRFPLFKENDAQSSENYSFKIIDATKTKFRPASFFKRNFLKLTSYLYEFDTIRRLRKEKKIDWMNIYTQYFGIFMLYFLYSKIFRYKTILHYVEFRSKFIKRSFFYRINDILFDKIAVLLCDVIIPISTTLDEYVRFINPKAKTLIIPPICDFKYFASVDSKLSDKKYFIFCSSITYEEVILFVIQSYLKLKNNENVDLHLVINGKIENQEINNLILENNKKIFLFSNLSYEDLIAKYKASLAALVPLRNTVQDCARFPQKICEFIASNRPIITTPYGEITNYFTSKKDAIIAKEYDIQSYSEEMDWAITHGDELETISRNSYFLGIQHFNIEGYSSKINNILASN